MGSRSILMSVLNFLSQKIYPGEFLRPEVVDEVMKEVMKEKVVFKMSAEPHQFAIF